MDLAWRVGAALFAVLGLLLACAAVGPDGTAAPIRASRGEGAPSHSDPLERWIDERTDPCHDFHQYACGGWLATTPLGSRQEVRLYDVIDQRNAEMIRGIVDRAANDPADPLGRFVRGCQSAGERSIEGSAAWRRLRDVIENATDARELWRAVAALHRVGVATLFRLEVFPSYDHPERNVLWLWQPTKLELPSDDALARASVSREDVATARRLQAELIALARSSRGLDEPGRRHHPSDVAGLSALAPGVSWSEYFDELELGATTPLNLTPPEYFAGLARVFAAHELAGWRALLRVRLVALANDLRPEHCVDSALRHAAGWLEPRFAAHVPGQIVLRAREVLARVQRGFEQRLQAATWLDASTRDRAMDKLASIRHGVGVPASFDEPPSVVIGDDHFDNVLALRQDDVQRALRSVGAPVDYDAWRVSQASAWSSNSLNLLVMPAGYLWPPHFDPARPAADNLGAVGTTFGHELAHLFDDQGRKFDARGRLEDWWTLSASSEFERRAECLVSSFAELQEGDAARARRQLSENIAELGGVRAAYQALENWAADSGTALYRAPVNGVLSPAQRFFVAYGQTQCGKYTPARARELTASSRYPLARDRINGIVRHVPEFQRAFACRADAASRPAQRCEIW